MTDIDKRPLKVFLCHASADTVSAVRCAPKVRELYRYLKKRGIQPWLDAEDLLPGQNWQLEIPKALECSDAIIICLSKESVDKEGYIQKEIKFSLDRALEMPEGRIFIIPARLDECDVPRSLSAYQWVDLFDESGCEKLMKSLNVRAGQLQRSSPKDGIPVWVNDNVQGKIIAGDENDAQSQAVRPEPERQVEPEPPVIIDEKGPSKPPRKLKTEYGVAIIGAAAIILAALIGILPQFIKPAPGPTPTPTVSSISLNPMEDTSWSPYLAPNAHSRIEIRTAPGKTGNALLISFTLLENEWVGISKSLYPGILVGTRALRFSYWGSGAANSVEVKLLYGLNQAGKSAVFSKLLNGITSTASWTTVDIPYTEFNCWTDTGCPAGKPIDVSQVLSLDFAISNKPGNPTGDGEFVIDDVEALK